MVFNSKQLEELENIHDSTGAFEEEGDDDGGFDEVGEAAMDWRRGLIEEAAENIKRAKTRPLEPHLQYPIGSMLYDRDVRRFARVHRSVPGYLKIVYLSGEDRELGTLDVVGYLKDYGADKRLSELSEQLGLPDSEVAHELDRLGIMPLPEPVEETPPEAQAAAAEAPPPPFAKPGKRAAAPAEEEDEEAPAVEVDEDGAPVAPAKGAKGAPAKPAAPAKGAPAKAAPAQKGKPAPVAAKAAAPAKGAKGGANPIDDPNGYIKANFNEMSNRELARLTGLSEHTIRRKLGEWGLKRKKEL
jgi:hypothetical protein